MRDQRFDQLLNVVQGVGSVGEHRATGDMTDDLVRILDLQQYQGGCEQFRGLRPGRRFRSATGTPNSSINQAAARPTRVVTGAVPKRRNYQRYLMV